MIIQMMMQSPTEKPVVNQVITNIYAQSSPQDGGRPATTQGVRRVRVAGKKKAHRNDPCPCGSGRKYKKCCMYRK